LQAARQAVADLKKQNSAFQERVHNLTHEVEDAEVRKSELENQLKSLQQVGFNRATAYSVFLRMQN